MPVIKLPASLPAISNKGLNEPELVAQQVLRELVLSLPFWKDGADLKKIDALLEIEQAIDDSVDGSLRISVDAKSFLQEAMQLRMPNGSFGALGGGPRANRFYMRMMRSVIVAGDE